MNDEAGFRNALQKQKQQGDFDFFFHSNRIVTDPAEREGERRGSRRKSLVLLFISSMTW
jgi:hypothetical protein